MSPNSVVVNVARVIAPGFAGTLIATVGPAPCFFINAASYGTRADLAAGPGWTDVARFGVHGIPAVNLGPGEAIEARQAEESVALDDLSSTFDALKEGRRSSVSRDADDSRLRSCSSVHRRRPQAVAHWPRATDRRNEA